MGLVLCSVLILVPPTIGAPASAHAPRHRPVAPAVRALTQQFPGTVAVSSLASNYSLALLDLLYLNGTNELVLYNGSLNSSRVVQAFVPGGFNTTIVTPISAGGAFFLGLENSTSGRESFEEVTRGGAVSSVSLPLALNLYWSFPYGNATTLFATASGNLLFAIDPVTHLIRSNLSGHLPRGAVVNALLPSGSFLYLAGSVLPPTGGTLAWFGYLNTSSGKVTTLIKSRGHPGGIDSNFYEISRLNGSLYFGGALQTFVSSPLLYKSDLGLLYRYTPATGVTKNLSSMLPVKGAGVYGIEPWRTTLAFSLSTFNVTASGSAISSGLFLLPSTGARLLNRSYLLPPGFVIYVLYVTSGTGGWLFSGGYNTTTGDAQVVAFRV